MQIDEDPWQIGKNYAVEVGVIGEVGGVHVVPPGPHGRGGRQLIEHDAAHIVAGVRGGLTLGSPITFSSPSFNPLGVSKLARAIPSAIRRAVS